MFCATCGAATQAGQRFCTKCGAALGTVAPAPVGEPVAGINIVEQTGHPGYEAGAAWDAGATVEPLAAPTAVAPVVVGRAGFSVTPLLVVVVLAAAVGIASAFVEVVAFRVTGVGDLDGTVGLTELSSSYLVGVVLASVLMVVGAVLGASGRAAGAGLAGGAGLAMSGMLFHAAGLAVAQLDAAEVLHLLPGATVTVTYEVGFFLVLGAAGLGALVFLLSLPDALADPSRRVPHVIGVIGSLGALAVAVGTVLPINGAVLVDNVDLDTLPPITLYLRLLVLAFVVVGGFVGFLTNRRWGLGMALGAVSVGAWQWSAAVVGIGDTPYSIGGGATPADVTWAGGNFFGSDTTPHLVTTVGVLAMLAAGLVGLALAARRST